MHHSENVEDQLRALTVEEKATLTSGSAIWFTAGNERLGVPRLMVSDGPHGLRVQPSDGDHAGVNQSLPATCFPTASAIASSWNPELVHRIGRALGLEARSHRLSVILGPGMNMKRSPLCGRNFEYFSEDPFLTGELAVGMVDGIQSRGVGTSVKHYAANNQESDRLRVDAQVDERTLREIYLPAFETVIARSRPWTVMCAYNQVNGQSVSENPWLLTTVLREEFGFDGVVLSDWGAVYHRVPALLAGTDLEMPPSADGRSVREVIAAVEAGDLPLEILDATARRMLELARKGRHVLDLDEEFDADAHHVLAREAAAESIVLLENDGLLPLQGQRIGVIGEFARTPRFQGAGSSGVNPTRVDSLIGALRDAREEVHFAPGYSLDNGGDPDTLREEAVHLAGQVDTVVLVIGLPASAESEGFDRTHMRLPAQHIDLLRDVAAVNARTVVVLVNGSSVELGEVTPYAAALLEAWLGGQAAGSAIADVLTGAVNPSGRLAETIPHRLEDTASYLHFPGDSHEVRYGEGLFIGYRGHDAAHQEVAYPLGYGLSYTTFEMSESEVRVHGSVQDGTLGATVSVTVTNTGDREGAEVVQVYVQPLQASVTRPVRELKGFAKIALQPGESRQATIELDQRAFAYWSVLHRRWVIEAGEFAIGVGHHSRDLPLTVTVTIDAPSLGVPLTRDSTLREWIDDQRGRALIDQEIAAGQPSTMLGERALPVIENMPMSTLANFKGSSLDHDAVDRVVAAWQRDEGA